MEAVEEKVYPRPLALHEDVFNNQTVFMESLRHFHATLGTRFMIPVIGGKELDLHLLYREVTSRGGLEKVVGEKKWKDVIAAFKFPPTTTSASFVLRKYYISLLHHYEQAYFFRLQGKLLPPSVIMASKSPPCKPEKPVIAVSAPNSMQLLQQQKQKEELMPIKRKKAEIGAPLSFPVVGMIDGKFDNGYFVTVTLGSKILRGVLYHLGSASTSSPIPENAIVPYGTPHLQRRRRRGKRRRDPSHPKPNRSAYNFFFQEKHSKLKLLSRTKI